MPEPRPRVFRLSSSLAHPSAPGGRHGADSG